MTTRFERKTNPPSEIITDPAELELFIDINNLNGELQDQPLLMHKWAKLKSQAGRRVKAIKAKLYQVERQVYDKLAFKGLKVKDMELMAKTDKNVLQVQNELDDAEAQFEYLTDVVWCFRQRHESLKDLAANARKAMLD
jgi:hypothetical protein